MSKWAQLESDDEKRSSTYYGLIVGLAMTFMVVSYLGNRLFASRASTSSRVMHENLLACMLKQPVAFFDSNPVGRVLNRFSKGQSCAYCSL